MSIASILITLTLVAAGALGVWLYTPDKARAELERQYASSPSEFIQVDGVRFHVRESGPKDRPAVLLLHGFGASLHTWEPWAAGLSKDYRTIRLDLPGFGLTEPDPTGDYSDQRGMMLLAGLMDKLSIARAVLIGHSMGGKLAWMFAARYPDRVDKLILIAPDGFESEGFEYGKKAAVPMLVRLLPYTLPAFMVRMNLEPAYGDPTALGDDALTRYRDMMLAPGSRHAMIARMEQVELQPPEPLLARITAPTLLLWGEKDAMIPVSNAKDYSKALPDSRLFTLPLAGHLPHEEVPEPSLVPVLAFLAR
jgi:pimeloyl-ACP methyl ester carboxylesterase